MALILRNGGSQSPDRWLKEPRNNHIIIKKENITIKEKCIEQIYNIIEKCTDEQALFFMNILDCIYENM